MFQNLLKKAGIETKVKLAEDYTSKLALSSLPFILIIIYFQSIILIF
jgi:hypothetical protein